MPSKQYKWSASKDDILEVDVETGNAVAAKVGFSHVIVSDLTLPEHREQAAVQVSIPVGVICLLVTVPRIDF